MEHDNPISKERRETIAKKRKSGSTKTNIEEVERAYGIYLSRLVKLNMIQMNPNDSLQNVGYAR